MEDISMWWSDITQIMCIFNIKQGMGELNSDGDGVGVFYKFIIL